MIAIIDYGVGNLYSVLNAFKSLGYEAVITSDKEVILNASKVVLPGVGAFKDAIDTLRERGFEPVIKKVIEKGTHLLGICVGMQMLFEYDYEFGVHKGLGILKGNIIKFDETVDNVSYKIPHMGWNSIEIINDKGILKGIPNNSYVYFVHSYHLDSPLASDVSAYANYGVKYGCVVECGNIHATQFHPEKSGEIGLQILRNFGEL
ncbi:MAG: imidazole glycerol phosphate synthase subunit HisH [Anaeroplasmataceae bacterium]